MARSTSNSFFRTSPAFSRSRCRRLFAAAPRNVTAALTLYFIEKVAFQEPYRLVKLQNRTELSDYLMEKYDTSWGQDTTRPFIIENDTLMDEYRPNPLEETKP